MTSLKKKIIEILIVESLIIAFTIANGDKIFSRKHLLSLREIWLPDCKLISRFRKF